MGTLPPCRSQLNLASSRRGNSCGVHRLVSDGPGERKRSHSQGKKPVRCSKAGWQFMTVALPSAFTKPRVSLQDVEKATVATTAFAMAAQVTGRLWTPAQAMGVRRGGVPMKCCCASFHRRTAKEMQELLSKEAAGQCVHKFCSGQSHKCVRHYLKEQANCTLFQ